MQTSGPNDPGFRHRTTDRKPHRRYIQRHASSPRDRFSSRAAAAVAPTEPAAGGARPAIFPGRLAHHSLRQGYGGLGRLLGADRSEAEPGAARSGPPKGAPRRQASLSALSTFLRTAGESDCPAVWATGQGRRPRAGVRVLLGRTKNKRRASVRVLLLLRLKNKFRAPSPLSSLGLRALARRSVGGQDEITSTVGWQISCINARV